MSIEFKSFTLSFTIHISIVAGYLLYFYSPVVLSSQEIQSVSINLIQESIEPTKQVKSVQQKEIVKTKPIEKKVEPKVLTKAELKSNRVIKKKIIKKEPVEVVKKEKSKEVLEKKQESVIEKNIDTKVTKKTRAIKSEKVFVKTNFELIRAKVLSHIVYPRMARKMKHTGVVHLALVIGIDGMLKDIRIEKSSGKSSLDKAALKAAQKLRNEILPKPQSISTVVLPVSFKLTS